ncbi:bifunctional phosphopantothenoylcysteine decarboxylase/phosphopantothenate--cysteine ligase CoaBC [Hyphomicrobiales bacterium]|jgi:phosphopantothenoylcysteine decarboxylase/phosphopantothenate--cysteine ligase|nr:bifunctional phosphopantothenoylcysteine decarboxylase/phosphopantothenate--cysteine ligase CoaBC [Rhodobiaceae bacterium]MBT6223611.1 bifunctional phosphopantothenoylcysteine decarboxylase/phosphopantothenate--cysteine ligase CoaBC [Rhodobiaceae bacterium]MDC0139547.1 bifunctional phosphopantothenoylcysteine decarboxylase/phosphopantothenate--cysteine ligase CoaBC [Hyphomicrobiales bacterium]
MTELKNKNVLLIIGGGIAAFKAINIVRLLKEEKVNINVILTQAGENFVTSLSLSQLSGNKVKTDLFDMTGELEMSHIELSRKSDIIIVAPATADLIAKMANGQANDLASTTLLAANKPIIILPSMNVKMWDHPATQININKLKDFGVEVLGPDEGEMACGEYGFGRMSEPIDLLNYLKYFYSPEKVLSKFSAIVTAGPTHEPIDPVRYIANRSSGKQGYAIAEALAKVGVKTTLISGPTILNKPKDVNLLYVETANEMLDMVKKYMPTDIAIFAAAVGDWRVINYSTDKMKKNGTGKNLLELEENPNILETISKNKEQRPKIVIGFAAETKDLIKEAKIKFNLRGADWILANDVSPENNVFGSDSNKIGLISKDGTEEWNEMSKIEVAKKLVKRIIKEIS